jgi:hypothetical protein
LWTWAVGAGELLSRLCRRLKYVAAIDYSP